MVWAISWAIMYFRAVSGRFMASSLIWILFWLSFAILCFLLSIFGKILIDALSLPSWYT
jgi:hypothetical protein